MKTFTTSARALSSVLAFSLSAAGLTATNPPTEKPVPGRVESGTIPAGPFELRYHMDGSGPPAIVIGSAILYPRIFSANLRRHLRLVFVDHRAFAKSCGKAEAKDYAFEVILDDIERVRTKLELGRVAIVGHSGHALMALEYAKRYPASVTQVVMIGMAPDLSPASATLADRYWEESADSERKQLLADNLEQLPEHEMARLTPMEQFVREYAGNGPRTWFDPRFDSTTLWDGVELNMDVFGHLWGTVFRDIDIAWGLTDFNIPVFLALGRYDFLVAPPSSWDPLRPKFKDLAVRVFERSGHAPQHEEPVLFDAELLQWMAEKRPEGNAVAFGAVGRTVVPVQSGLPRVEPMEGQDTLHRLITREWPSAAMRGDPDSYVGFLTDDMLFMPPNQEAIADKPALREWLNQAFAAAKFDIKIHEPVEIVVSGEWAFARYRVGLVGRTNTGESFSADRKYIDIWRQVNGVWKCHRHIWNDNTPTIIEKGLTAASASVRSTGANPPTTTPAAR